MSDAAMNPAKQGHTEKDLEAGSISPEKTPSASSPERSINKEAGFIELPVADTKWGRFVDSFKRNPNARVTPQPVDAEGRPLGDAPVAEPALAMKLKNRCVPMAPPKTYRGSQHSQLTKSDICR